MYQALIMKLPILQNIYICTRMGVLNMCEECTEQGSSRNSKTQFHDFSMIFYDQQCNFHDYLMHSLQTPLLVASSPCWA